MLISVNFMIKGLMCEKNSFCKFFSSVNLVVNLQLNYQTVK